MSSIGGKGENKDSSAMKCGRVGSCPIFLCRYEKRIVRIEGLMLVMRFLLVLKGWTYGTT